MKKKWPAVRLGCIQYKVRVEKKNEGLPLALTNSSKQGFGGNAVSAGIFSEGLVGGSYSFSDNKDLEKALESGKEYIRTYTSAAEIEAWIVE